MRLMSHSWVVSLDRLDKNRSGAGAVMRACAELQAQQIHFVSNPRNQLRDLFEQLSNPPFIDLPVETMHSMVGIVAAMGVPGRAMP